MIQHKYVDISGHILSGKSAFGDLFREFRGYYVPDFRYEFLLLRIQDGIRDLETALVADWSPIRSDAALRRFERLIHRLGVKTSWTDPRSWFSGVGWNYEEIYNQQFFILSKAYVQSLIQDEWTEFWPFRLAEIGGGKLFLKRAFQKIGVKSSMDFKVRLVGSERFLELTREYLDRLLFSNVPEETTCVVLHNAFEPFYPERALRYFDQAFSLIPDRDPRDNYMAYCQYYGPAVLPVDKFIRRYRWHRERINKNRAGESPHILRIQYEDLVLKYEKTVIRILDFLGERADIHVTPGKYFNPAISIKNIGLWKEHANQAEIDKIYRELREFCYD